jgi:hypothetical protein
MIQKTNNKNLSDKEEINKENKNIEKTLYPSGEDIYNQNKKEDVIDPQNITTTKELNTDKEDSENLSGNDLDIPGSELDNDGEDIGNEDEENNYYSLGGDDHNTLDEDQGD